MPVSSLSSKDLKSLQRGQEENNDKYAEVTSLWLFRFDIQALTPQRVSWDVLSTTDFLLLIYFLAKQDSAPRSDERDAAKRRKTHRTLEP